MITNVFSKKVDNLACAVALHFMYYNFCRIHQSLRITPAMAAKVINRLWNIEDIVALLDAPTSQKNMDSNWPTTKKINPLTKNSCRGNLNHNLRRDKWIK